MQRKSADPDSLTMNSGIQGLRKGSGEPILDVRSPHSCGGGCWEVASLGLLTLEDRVRDAEVSRPRLRRVRLSPAPTLPSTLYLRRRHRTGAKVEASGFQAG